MTKFVMLFFLGIGSLARGDESQNYIIEHAMETKLDTLAPTISDILNKYRVVIIGEHHGTKQIPKLALQIAQATSANSPVILALEIQKSNQRGLDQYYKTGDEIFLKILPHFAREYQDGRSSVAMAQILISLAKNSRIKVVCFDVDSDSGNQDRNSRMALNLDSIIKKYPGYKLVVLTGNIHASKKIGNQFDPLLKPMAYELSHAPGATLKADEIFSIKTRYGTASAWVCTDGDSSHCGPKSLAGSEQYAKASKFENYFIKESRLTEDGYDATFFLRRVDSSPPFELD